MSLDLPKVLPQVAELSRHTQARLAHKAELLPSAIGEFRRWSERDPHELAERLKRLGAAWHGPLLTDEPPGETYPAAPHPPRLHVLGADGSQIYPDRHAYAFFYLLNIGSLHLTHGSGEPPQAASFPVLAYRDEDLRDENDRDVDTSIIHARRDVAEIQQLARLAEASSGDPSVALVDNSLFLWLALQERDRSRREGVRLLAEYLRALDQVRQTGAALAGYIDQPRSPDVLSLLHLASLPPEAVSEETIRSSPFRGLSDADLFGRCLPPGHRSARFIASPALNRDYAQRGHPIQFFYLHTGYGDRIARVEIPAWVGDLPQALAWVHAGLLEECRVTGFPYVLVRAHELAVVGQADRKALDDLLAASLARHGMLPRISQKAETKKWTAQRRRHRL
jgi:hypothetical protein